MEAGSPRVEVGSQREEAGSQKEVKKGEKSVAFFSKNTVSLHITSATWGCRHLDAR